MSKRTFLSVGVLCTVILALGGGILLMYSSKKSPHSFKECVELQGVVMESYPAQCRYGATTFVENIGNGLEKENLIRVSVPRPNTHMQSPLEIAGEARGTWFFEASFPIQLMIAGSTTPVAIAIAQADGEWMTEDFVPFHATLIFTPPVGVHDGELWLMKDNPSGDPIHDDILKIPVTF